ncbi:hypothetical protein FA09DRAFT_358681 [Tilletiopsis washingtonensis]|uniref:Zn(2)-C6 fungal-type domain-containing protein n=1 Tax=Tilletiopsis washingtonensis TaxID=58919 RepID=A0A316ZGJ7_9BASI|nr:hypothetical protein FA09DRAFT_358681 [Tilletiopsis washingtonensis]PWO00632.1 hypothetical protein FA09DRAFT_358681 [Tilletiopsis washingtonensis]
MMTDPRSGPYAGPSFYSPLHGLAPPPPLMHHALPPLAAPHLPHMHHRSASAHHASPPAPASTHDDGSRKRPRSTANHSPPGSFSGDDGDGGSPPRGRNASGGGGGGGAPGSSTGKESMRTGLSVKSRIHRACNACRKQKMRCEGPVNAPCNRCESSGLPCIFEKPAREPAPSTVVVAAPASEESMARLRALEGKMEGLSSTLGELVAVLRESKQLPDPHGRALPPSGRWDAAGSVSSPVSRLAPSYSSPGTVLHPLAFPAPRSYNGESAAAWTGPVVSAPRAVTNPSFSPTSRHRQAVDSSRGYGAAPSRPWEEPSSSRDEGESWTASAPNPSRMPPPPSARPLRAGGRRDRAGGRDEDYNDEDRASYLPAESFGAPIAALRGLADAAEHHAATEEAAFAISNKASSTSSRADDVLMDERRPLGQLGKRRRVEEAEERLVDVVTSGAVEEEEARRLWRTFGRGCGRFMSVFNHEDKKFFDEEADLFGKYRRKSPFLFDTILYIGARVDSAGGPPSASFRTCLAASQRHASATLLGRTKSNEDVQAMLILASYTDSQNGWLQVGHACRMAQQLGLDKVFPRLMAAVGGSGEANLPHEQLAEMASGSRIWFFSFLLEHQLSYGAGREPMLTHPWVRNARNFLSLPAPLSMPVDVRILATLELMTLREHRLNTMAPFDATIDGAMLRRVNALGADLDSWEQYWYGEHHARGFDANGFFLESLRLQGATARLYLCCTCLRGVHQPGDAERMTEAQREIAQSTVRAADLVLDIATGSSATSAEYYEKLRWAPIYTHVTATFACVFLLKCVVLFPSLVDAHSIFARAEKLALRLRETAAAKYGDVILRMQWQTWKRIAATSRKRGLRLMFGDKTPRQGSFTPADIERGGMTDADFQEVLRLLVRESSPTAGGETPSSPSRDTWGTAGSPARLAKRTSYQDDSHATLHLPPWAQSDFALSLTSWNEAEGNGASAPTSGLPGPSDPGSATLFPGVSGDLQSLGHAPQPLLSASDPSSTFDILAAQLGITSFY